MSEVTEPVPDTEPPPGPPRWQKALVGVVLLGALVGLVLTVRAATTGNDRTSESLPESVDRLLPASGSEVIRQEPVGIDVAAGYDAYLVIDGQEIGEGDDGFTKDLGTGLIQYVPGPGRKVEALDPERNCIIAYVWKQSEGRRSAQAVPWCFSAS